MIICHFGNIFGRHTVFIGIPPVSKVASGNPFFLAGDSPMDKAESEKAGAVSWGPS